MTTLKQHADSKIKEIRLKAEIVRLEIQEAKIIIWSQVTLIAGLVLTGLALISTI